jgi:hypothetical protein
MARTETTILPKTKQPTRKLGKDSTDHHVSNGYVHCVEALIEEITLATWKSDT